MKSICKIVAMLTGFLFSNGATYSPFGKGVGPFLSRQYHYEGRGMNSSRQWFLAVSFGVLLGLTLCAPVLHAQGQNSTNSSGNVDTPSPSDDGWHVNVV